MLALAVSLSLTAQVSSAQSYDELIVAARAGNNAPALSFFASEARQRALKPDEIADWLQIAGWAGDDAQVVSVWQRYATGLAMPVRGQQAAARALRNLQQWPRALTLWRAALAREPDNDDLHSGLIMTLADAGHSQQAIALARQRLAQRDSARHWLDLAYSQRAAGKHQDALASTSIARFRFPASAELQRDYRSDLSLNRISGPALLAGASASPDAGEQRRLDSAAVAEQVRIAFTSSRTEAERFAVADRALARYDILLRQWKQHPAAHADYQRARIDRLGALVARSRMAEATREYQQLLAEGETIPAWAQRWVAAAYLYQRQPQQALALYQSAQADGAQPTAQDNNALFYARAEDERLLAARQQAATLAETTPRMLHVYGSPVPVPNDAWLDAQQLRVQADLLNDDLPAATRRAERLARSAPNNQGLQIDVAALWLMRGWPRRAEAELKRVESMEPRNLALENQQGLTALALQEWHQADLLADDVMARQPENSSARRLDRLRDVQHKYELRISAERGLKSDSPVSGANDSAAEALLYGPPMADNWRLFSGLSFAGSEFTEGRARNRGARGGVEYRARDVQVEAELNGQRYGSGQKVGARVAAWRDLDDRWRVGGSAAYLMHDTPLRALRDGITASGGSLWGRWRQDERREWQATLSPSWFSDGNQRLEFALDGKERLASGGRYSLDFTPGISASHNSKTGGAYYSPASDLAVIPALTLDHLLYRHYQTEWSQQVEAGVGSYWQQGQGSGAVTRIGYGQRVRWNDVLDTGVMLSWDKRPYDGVREQNLSVSFDMNYRF